jgi:hypothetical protein
MNLKLRQDENVDEVHRSVYFAVTNGLRSLRKKCYESRALVNIERNKADETKFQIFLIVVIFLSLGFTGLVFYEIWVIERNRDEILTLYSYLNLIEIREVY